MLKEHHSVDYGRGLEQHSVDYGRGLAPWRGQGLELYRAMFLARHPSVSLKFHYAGCLISSGTQTFGPKKWLGPIRTKLPNCL